MNKDGIDDLIVGVPGADLNGVNSGASYVVFGNRNRERYHKQLTSSAIARRQ
ncbi:integrin alpha [Sphingorhabdus sp.]|uniref:integrin alpha n=1 Tax=Sphingorhabdus sp. TaxID=1902408 RepID=UPI003D81ABDC